MIISCLDSRVPPEIVFDQGIGDVFVARVAGNIVNSDILGSTEFATQVKHSRLVVVLGHTACGAVAGACQNVKLGHLTGLLKNIQPAVDATRKSHASFDPKNPQHIDHTAEENVRRQVTELTKRSPILAELVKSGKLKVVGAMYDLATGQVRFL